MTIISARCPATTRAMTCHAPFAYALALGEKTQEYRSRVTQYRGWIFFHCGISKQSDDAFQYLEISPEDAQRGCIIGAGYLNDCLRLDNYFAYEFINPVLFEKPLRIRGKQQTLWLPADSKEVKIFASAWQELQRINPTA